MVFSVVMSTFTSGIMCLIVLVSPNLATHDSEVGFDYSDSSFQKFHQESDINFLYIYRGG